jgi:hypothetical protein
MEKVVEFPKRHFPEGHTDRLAEDWRKSDDYVRLLFAASNGLQANAIEAAYLHGLMDGYKDVLSVMANTVVGNA